MAPTFTLNGRAWKVTRVAPGDAALVDRTGTLTVATTDPATGIIRVSSALRGEELARVMVHEVAHAAMVSNGLLEDLHAWARPGFEVRAEEWACNLLADYGLNVLRAAHRAVGPVAWDYLPREFERMFAAR